MVVDQPNTIGALPVTVARACGHDVAYLPGLSMRRVADLHPGQAKTDARDAFIIADTARTMPHTLRRVDVRDETLTELGVLVGFDDDLAGEATRIGNRIRGLLTGIHPALERAVGPKISHPAVLEIVLPKLAISLKEVLQQRSLAVVVGMAWFGLWTRTSMIWVAILGAGVAALFAYVVGSLGRDGATPLKLAPSGAATSAVLTSFITSIRLPRNDIAANARSWQIGGVGGASFDAVWAGLPILAVGFAICLLSARSLNSLALGDEVAAGLGARVGLVRTTTGLGAVPNAPTFLCLGSSTTTHDDATARLEDCHRSADLMSGTPEGEAVRVGNRSSMSALLRGALRVG